MFSKEQCDLLGKLKYEEGVLKEDEVMKQIDQMLKTDLIEVAYKEGVNWYRNRADGSFWVKMEYGNYSVGLKKVPNSFVGKYFYQARLYTRESF